MRKEMLRLTWLVSMVTQLSIFSSYWLPENVRNSIKSRLFNINFCSSLADVPGATHADDVYAYFNSKYTPQISIPSVEFEIIKTMVNLITDFATNLQSQPFDGQWTPVGKTDAIPKVLNINNEGISMIPFPEYNQIKVFNEIYTEAKVDLI
jgi:hypothetical protein